MEPTFGHPRWIVAGILLILGGIWLFRWGRRNDLSAAIAVAATEAAINKLRRNSPVTANGKPKTIAGSRAGMHFRNSMAQFLGIVGVLMIIAGLVAMIFGVVYQGG